MGVYIYRIASPSRARTVEMGGEKVLLAGLVYAYKPWWGGPDPDKANEECERRYVDPARRAWRNKDKPAFVIHDTEKGELTDGAEVHKWWANRVTWADCDRLLDRVGVLRKRGKRWIIETGTKCVGVDVVRDEVHAGGVYPEGCYVFHAPEDWEVENGQMLELSTVLEAGFEQVGYSKTRWISHPKMTEEEVEARRR